MRTSPLSTWRAREFYEQKLGLKAKQEINGGVVLEFGKGTGCFMYPTSNAGTDMPELKREGDIYTGGGARAAWFKDSEGNTLAIIQNA